MEYLSCNIIERDNNGDLLWSWIFPSISENRRSHIIRKCTSDAEQISLQQFIYGRFDNTWWYITWTDVFESDNLPNVKQVALILFTNKLYPEKYETLSRILSKAYCKSGSPTLILQLYLSVVTQGSCTTPENGTFYSDFYKNNESTTIITMVKDLIKMFGLETILIYTGLLLKKRIIIYHHSLQLLLKWIRTFPALMSHRDTDDWIYPWVELIPEEIVDLKSCTTYLAGCCNSNIAGHTEIYDLLINLPAREISVAPHAKDSMAMTKTHKDIAVFMVQLADNASESRIIKDIAEKTQELLNQLKSIAVTKTPDGKSMVSIETLRQKNFPPALENFLFNLAVAENIMML